MKKLEIFQFLIDHFNARDNDYQEKIKLLDVNDVNVVIQTQFIIEMQIIDVLEVFMMNGPQDISRRLIKDKLAEAWFIDNIGFNYVSGFYMEHIEGLDIDDFLDNSESKFEDNRHLILKFNMNYKIQRSEIERMMIGYKNCA